MKINAYRYLKYYKKEMILGPAFKILEVIFELITPFLMAYIIDTGINRATEFNDYSAIYIPGIIILALSVLGLSSTLVCQYFASIASQGYGTKLRNALYEKIMGLSLREIELVGKGNLVTLITNDVNRVQLSVAMMVRLVLRAPALIIGSLICAFIIDYKFAFIFLGVVIIISLILFFVIKYSSKRVLTTQKAVDELVTISNDSLSGIRVVKAFNNEEYEINKFKYKTSAYYKEMKKVNLLNAITNPVTFLIINIAIVLIVYFSGVSALNGTDLSSGNLTSLISYLNQILLALIVVSNLVVIFTKAFASKKRIENILSMEPSIKNDPKYRDLKINNGEPIFVFKNASFKYETGDNLVVSNLNFEILKGETVGIIGGTGSGKTTIIKLLERFFDVTSGHILYKGVDIKDYDLTSLHDEISLVNQRAVLFKGTIKSNLMMANKNATNEDINNALKDACAFEFVSNYKDGLDHEVEEGGKNFSGGQRQRLSIARSILKNSEVLILDDSTSALDYLTEKTLRNNLKSKENLTKIIIAQRISSLQNADKIIVMYHGNIEAIGKHDDLLKTSKVYKEIYESQEVK